MNEDGEAAGAEGCGPDRIEALGQPAWGNAPPPWAPGYREEAGDLGHSPDGRADGAGRLALLAKIDILADLSEPEVNAIVDAAPARTYRAGELLYTPHRPVEALFLLKRGRIRVFRVAPDGPALTTAIVSPGTMFGEMALLGHMPATATPADAAARAYRFQRFRTALLIDDLTFGPEAPGPGDQVPAFELPTLGTGR